MNIQSSSRIEHPFGSVFLAYRDRLPEVAAFVPDVAAIVVRARRELPDGTIELHNEWSSDREVPAVLSSIVRQDQLCWDDFASWAPSGLCTWRIQTRAFTEAVRCSGTTRLVADGAGTRVELSGSLTLGVEKVRGIPRLLASRIGPQLEKFVVSLVTPNLEKTNVAIARFLDAEGRR